LVRDAEESGKLGLIIDMRPNPGGLLDETVETADLFLDGGIVLTEVHRSGQRDDHNATPGGAALDIPIVILMDEHSASGAEVLGAALRDNGRATIIGEKSFGKGTVNIERNLDDGGALFVTIRQWLTPQGQLIDRVGVTPDIEVTPGPLDAGYDPAADAQLLRAIDQLHGVQASGGAAPEPATPQ
jgi:carboxyl-terminal processing protease